MNSVEIDTLMYMQQIKKLKKFVESFSRMVELLDTEYIQNRSFELLFQLQTLVEEFDYADDRGEF